MEIPHSAEEEERGGGGGATFGHKDPSILHDDRGTFGSPFGIILPFVMKKRACAF